MHTRPVRQILAVAAAALVLAGGCATPITAGPGDAGDSTHSPVLDGSELTMIAGVSCTATETAGFDPSAPTPVRLAAGFVPVSATRCLLEYREYPGDGEWLVRVEQQVDGDLAPLAERLRRPDEVAPPNTACTLIGYVPIIITLHDAAGATTVPALPTTGCGAPQPGAVEAINSLDWRTVTETKVRQLRSQEEVTTLCPGTYKPVVALAVAGGQPPIAVVSPVFPENPARLQVCHYVPDAADTMEVGGVRYQVGRFASSRLLDGTAAADLQRALADAPAGARPCATQQPRFAAVYPVGEPGRAVIVETDACHRFTDANGGLRQLDPVAATLLSN